MLDFEYGVGYKNETPDVFSIAAFLTSNAGESVMAKPILPSLNKHGKKKPDITCSRLKELLRYEKETGIFYWRNHRRVMKAGDSVGGKIPVGYLTVDLDGRRYYLHRLAWLYEFGEMPCYQIDHINGDKLDNRIINLRHVEQKYNQRNTKKHKDRISKFKGVSFIKLSKPWKGQIYIEGKNVSKDFETEIEAAIWYDDMARKHFRHYGKFNFPKADEQSA